MGELWHFFIGDFSVFRGRSRCVSSVCPHFLNVCRVIVSPPVSIAFLISRRISIPPLFPEPSPLRALRTPQHQDDGGVGVGLGILRRRGSHGLAGGDPRLPHHPDSLSCPGNLRGRVLFLLGSHAEPLHPGCPPVIRHEYFPSAAEFAGSGGHASDRRCPDGDRVSCYRVVVRCERLAPASIERVCETGYRGYWGGRRGGRGWGRSLQRRKEEVGLKLRA